MAERPRDAWCDSIRKIVLTWGNFIADFISMKNQFMRKYCEVVSKSHGLGDLGVTHALHLYLDGKGTLWDNWTLLASA